MSRCDAVDDFGMGRCLLDAHDGQCHAWEDVPGPEGPLQKWQIEARAKQNRRGRVIAEVAWRVVYEDGGWNTFHTDPSQDAARALAALMEDRAAGEHPQLLCSFGGVWFAMDIMSACSECEGTRVTKQGWTDKNGYSEDQYGPCVRCCGHGTVEDECHCSAFSASECACGNYRGERP